MTESLVNKEAFPVEEHGDFGRRWMTGAALLIVADASFVVALSFTYLYLRALNTERAFHPPDSATASLWWPWAVTAAMFASLVAYRYAMSEHEPARLGFVTGGVIAVLGMTAALALNITQIATFPFKVWDNAYASAVYVLAAGNVFHLLVTLFLGVGVVNRVRRKVTRGRRDWHVRIVGMWWTWVCVAALIGALTVSVANGTVG
jgi:heme/copper-type cytochrome/quinol oxidase subunit 3